jgi:hypothetical protein
MTVRDAAVTDTIPKMTQLEGYGDTGNPRMVYNLGHAVFEFIESKFGREGFAASCLRLRKSVIGGGEDAYEEAFQMKPEEFDSSFERYMKERFKAFATRSVRRLRPRSGAPRRTHAVSRGAVDRTLAVRRYHGHRHRQPARRRNRHHPLVDARRFGDLDLTNGFDKDMGIDHIVATRRTVQHRAVDAWSPDGNKLAYFARTGKERSLIIQNSSPRRSISASR